MSKMEFKVAHHSSRGKAVENLRLFVGLGGIDEIIYTRRIKTVPTEIKQKGNKFEFTFTIRRQRYNLKLVINKKVASVFLELPFTPTVQMMEKISSGFKKELQEILN